MKVENFMKVTIVSGNGKREGIDCAICSAMIRKEAIIGIKDISSGPSMANTLLLLEQENITILEEYNDALIELFSK